MSFSFPIRVIILGGILSLAGGCATTRKSAGREAGAPNSGASASEIYGPPVPAAPPTYGPDPVQVKPIVLVLGPGLARGFAYAGALRALHEQKIPIGAIFGTEMGGLIGAVYAMDGNINHFEWALMKFKGDVFTEQKSFFTNILDNPQGGEKLEKELKKVFTDRDINDAKLTLRVAVQPLQLKRPTVMDRGKVAKILRAAMADEGLLTPIDYDGLRYASALESRPFQVLEAKSLSLGPVVVIDVLKAEGENSEAKPNKIDEEMLNASKNAESDLKNADLVIHVEMKGIEFLDFNKRTEAAFRGKRAILDHIAEIKQLVGGTKQ